MAVVTILLGCLKLWYTHWRLRKHTAVALKKKAMVRTQSARRVQEMRQEKEGEIPFGIRAIESGIEVDGVWISRTNTPAPSSRGSMTASSIWSHSMHPGFASNTFRPESQHAPDSNSNSNSNSRANSRPSSLIADKAESTQMSTSRPPSPEPTARPPRSRYPPISFSRYASPYVFRNSATLRSLEGYEPPPQDSTYETGGNEERRGSESSARNGYTAADRRESSGLSSDSARQSSNGSNDMPVSTVDLLSPESLVNRRTDLDLLQSHRLSHVAETGQLTPRIRRYSQGGESANFPLTPSASRQDTTEYFAPRKKSPSPPSSGALSSSATPKTDTPSTAPSTAASSLDSHAANVSAQAKPLLGSYRPMALEAEQRSPSEFAHQKRQSQVIRKVNSGFEILRPGSLDSPQMHTEAQSESRSSMESKRSARKLQKKRRSSTDSRRSGLDLEM
ncbi:hypothetical protein LTR50_004467 [Elasticomyces elasticus]|nr:hypothetical protein LTR50_004467 [Elasticomyces elasticus]